MESPTVLCNLLRRHNKYLKTTSAVPIFGLKASALQTDVILDNGETHDLIDFIEQYIPEIESVERTNKTTADGKWFLVCRQTKIKTVYTFVDEALPDIFTRFVSEDDRLQGYPCPKRLPPQSRSKQRQVPKIVGTYASVLRQYSSNPQGDDQTADNNAEYNIAPERPRKRQAVQLTFDNNSFPSLPGNQNTETQATPSTVTQVIPPQPSDLDKRLADMEQRLQVQINTMQSTQANNMTTILEKFEITVNQMATDMKVQVNQMATDMNTVMHSIAKTLQDFQNPQIPNNNAIQHLTPIQIHSPHGGTNNNTVASPSSQTKIHDAKEHGNQGVAVGALPK